MGLLKSIFLGLMAAILIGSIAQKLEGRWGEVLRLYTLQHVFGGLHLYFSIPIFIGVGLFCWIFLFWSRD